MNTYVEIFDLLIVITGVYMISWGFTGKGPMFKMENIKDGYQEKYKVIVKWFCLAGGILAIAMGAVDHFRIEPLTSILFYVLCAVVVAAFVVNFLCVDKEKAQRNNRLRR